MLLVHACVLYGVCVCRAGVVCIYVCLYNVPPITTQNGCAPIHLATCRNHLSIVQYLCECHCNVDILDKVVFCTTFVNFDS